MVILLTILFVAAALAGQEKYLVFSVEVPIKGKGSVEYVTRAEGESLPLISREEKMFAGQYIVTVERSDGKVIRTDTFGFGPEFSTAPDGKFIDGGKVHDPNRSVHVLLPISDSSASSVVIKRDDKEVLAFGVVPELERLMRVSLEKEKYLESAKLEQLFKEPPSGYGRDLVFLRKVRGALHPCASFPKKRRGRCEIAVLMIDALIGRIKPAKGL